MSEPTAPPTPPLVTIIIPCRNEAQHIERCLESALHQDPPDGGLEVIVADGMSDDGTRQILGRIANGGIMGSRAKRTSIRMIDNPRRIVSAGLNAAIRAAAGEIIIRMDAHSEYASDYVRQCVAVLRQTGADNAGGPWVAKGAKLVSVAVAAAFQSPFASGGARSHESGYEGLVDTVYLGCWRRDVFKRFGYFDEELVRNQDDEHNLRITRGGGRIYQSPKIRSWYRPRNSLPTLFRQYMQYGYWKVRVIQKHRLPASSRHLVPGAFVLTLALLFLASILCLLAFGGPVITSHGSPTTDHQLLTPDPWRLPPELRLAAPILLLALLGFYGACVVAASLHAAWRSGWKLLPILPLVFGCYHFGYGFGFLRGFWDFVIRRKGAGAWSTKLTRGEPKSVR